MSIGMNWILIIVIGIVGMLVQWRLKSVFAKYSKVLSPGGLTGAQIAQKMLNDNGIYDVSVTCIKGQLTDHYDPTKKTVNLSEDVYRMNSVSAAAVAAHECGHAIQHKVGYAPLKLRSALVPTVNISSKLSMIVILIGLAVIQVFPALFWIGIAMFAMVFLFSLITLPVEFNASKRALAWLQSSNSLQQTEVAQAKEALGWAASTYVVAALSSLVSLLYYIGLGNSRR
ncbi:MAG: zinc metallopeptidase [Bacteroidales bacterium]|nr:zinc metallopeptidase [Bacteroidales bacterium]MBR0539629.1 zinc metallopeptidase [Bacteroidales bacterium]